MDVCYNKVMSSWVHPTLVRAVEVDSVCVNTSYTLHLLCLIFKSPRKMFYNLNGVSHLISFVTRNITWHLPAGKTTCLPESSVLSI